jgi:hypothetical protein
MAKGGSKNTVQKQEVTQSNIPEYARPYFENMMQRAGSALTTPYQTYGQERIAGFTDQQKNLQNEMMGQKTPGQFGMATDFANQAGLGALNAGKYSAAQYGPAATYDPTKFNVQMFGNEQAQQYMSPYIQNVLDIQKREATGDAKRGQLMQDLGASRQGAYGGSRQLLAGMERERNLGQQMGDIQAKGLQSAYESAQQQFERDRRQDFEAQQAAEQSKQFGAGFGEQSRQFGADFGERSRQFGADLGLRGYGLAGDMAQKLANIGSAQQQGDLARFGMQQGTAAQQQALNQQYLDMAYQDFMRQRDYPMEQLQQYSGFLRGLPVTPNTTATTYAPGPSMGQQLMGAGLGALGMYKTLGS